MYIQDISRGGLSPDVIASYQASGIVKGMVKYIQAGGVLPPIEVYSKMVGDKWVIADGIHRFCTYLLLSINEFETYCYDKDRTCITRDGYVPH